MTESSGSRWRTMARRAQRDGLVRTLWSGLKRVGNDLAPSWFFRARDVLLVAMPQVSCAHIPALRGARARIVDVDQISELLPIAENPSRLHQLFDQGSICAAAEAPGGQIGAMAWAWLGPGDCPVDARYSHGLRCRLRAGEAWVHNGEASPALRRTGIYLAAYRALLEELARRGVRRCYGQISMRNTESLQVHRRLGLSPVAQIVYRRIALIGFYHLRCGKTTQRTWTLRSALTISPTDWLESVPETADQPSATEAPTQRMSAS
jgi:hypothetical protein